MNDVERRLPPEVHAVVKAVERIVTLLREVHPAFTGTEGFEFSSDDFSKLDFTKDAGVMSGYVRVRAGPWSRSTLAPFFAHDGERNRRIEAGRGMKVEVLLISFQPFRPGVENVPRFSIHCKAFSSMVTREMKDIMQELKHASPLFHRVLLYDEEDTHMTFISKGEVIPFPGMEEVSA